LMAVVCWVLLMLKGKASIMATGESLGAHLQEIAQIVFFLMGAMTIVKLIDAHNGFKVITDFIKTRNTRALLWVISIITFLLSSVLDNLTTAIVMLALVQRLINDKQDRLIFASMIIIAANAGGAWTPIGDVTTTMLWIGGRITSLNIMQRLFIPSLVSLLVPLTYFSFSIKKNARTDWTDKDTTPEYGAKILFYTGVGVLIFVPVFRALTNLPPFMGVILGLGVMWIITDLLHREKEDLRMPHVLSKIDFSSILFFLGILLTISALDTAGILNKLAVGMEGYFHNKDIIGTLLGLGSAIVDNVPLTAATMGMYSLAQFPVDSKLWELLAFAVGTGGSILIIGSAAGVVVMGMEKITFTWYVRRVSIPALVGYFAGVISYLAMYQFLQ